MIPMRIIQLWGYKDDFNRLPEDMAALRKANIAFLLGCSARWSFELYGPTEALEIAARYFPATDSDLIIKALSISNCHWITQVDIARFVILYAFGGIYLDLDVLIKADLQDLLSASLLLTRGSTTSAVELDIAGAVAGDWRILELLRTQASNVLKRRGHGQCPAAGVSVTTGVKVVTRWAVAHGLSAKPLADRFIRAKGSGACKAFLKTYMKKTWAATIQVRTPYFVVHHSATWCRAGAGLRKSVFKPTIQDTSTLGNLKAWNTTKRQPGVKPEPMTFHPSISLPPVMQQISSGNGNLTSQLALLRAVADSFPVSDFAPLSIVSELKDSADGKRMQLARILVTKAGTENQRRTLVKKVAELDGKLHRDTMKELITCKGVMTPRLKKFLQVSCSAAASRRWKKRK